MMQTNIQVCGVGDIRNTPFKQAVVAAGDGCIAAMDIDRYLKQRRTSNPIGVKLTMTASEGLGVDI